MKIKILSWNVRGANDASKRKLIKMFRKTQKADVICIQETKWKSCSKGLVWRLVSNNFVDWVASCFEGASGGVVILWDTRVVQLVVMEESSYTLSCRLRNCANDFCWIFMGIYGPTKRENMELLWEDLGGAIRGMWGDPWCIGGDFNVLRFPGERNREGRWKGTMRIFS